MIMESFHLAATDTDVLASPSRLASIPYAGTMIIEMQCDINDASNYFSCTLQLPNGDVPIDGQRISEGANAGSLNLDDKYVVQFPVQQGGHVLLNLTETGTSTINVRVTLMP